MNRHDGGCRCIRSDDATTVAATGPSSPVRRCERIQHGGRIECVMGDNCPGLPGAPSPLSPFPSDSNKVEHEYRVLSPRGISNEPVALDKWAKWAHPSWPSFSESRKKVESFTAGLADGGSFCCIGGMVCMVVMLRALPCPTL